MLVKDLFTYPIERAITQVIKVEDDRPNEIAQELREYVVTNQIEKSLLAFLELFVATRKGQQTQTDQIGVWLSGFFGSGKSHLAKMISHLLENRQVAMDGSQAQAIDLFLDRVADDSPHKQELRGLLTQIRNFFQNQVLMFQIMSHEDMLAKDQRESISVIMYSRYLQAIGLSKDPWTGSLELRIKQNGCYDDFCAAFERLEGASWQESRHEFSMVRSNVERALQEVMPHRYHSVEEAARAIEGLYQSLRLTPDDLVQELSSYAESQDKQAGQRSFKLVFIIDEMGQFIGEDGGRLLELQTISEAFSKQGQGRLWLLVTAQEALDQIIQGVKQRKADYARIIDRFNLKIIMTSDQIEQVIEERILKKRPAAQTCLSDIYTTHQGLLSDIAQPTGNRTIAPMTEEQFVRSYPFLPYQFPLMQAIFANLRARGGKSIQLSGAERSMLGVVQGVMNAPTASFAAATPGRLATLDEIYDQVLREVSSDDRRTIGDVNKQVQPGTLPADKVLKAVFLLSQIDWFPRTLDNITRVLLAAADASFQTHQQHVEEMLETLQSASYVTVVDGAYRYLSAAERGIEEEIASEQPKHYDIRRTARELLTAVLQGIGRVNYMQGIANFEVRVFADDEEIKSSGDLLLKVYSPVAQSYDRDITVDLIRDVESPGNTSTVYWLPADVTDTRVHLERLLRMEAVINRRSGKDVGEEERAILREKDNEINALRRTLTQTFSRALFTGAIIYDGGVTPLDARTTTSLSTIFNRELSKIIPKVYTQFSTAAVNVTEQDVSRMLSEKVENLQTVVPELKLWDAQGHINTHAPIAQAVLAELNKRGIAIDGKTLVEYFKKVPYGWQPLVVRIVLAALFRAGTITLSSGQRQFPDPGEPGVHEMLTRTTKFNRAVFNYDPQSGLSLDQRNEAQRQLDVLFNRKVDDTTNTLATTLREELGNLLQQNKVLLAQVQGINLPVSDLLFQGEVVLNGILGKPRQDGMVKAFLNHTGDLPALQNVQQQVEDFFAQGHDATYRQLQSLLTEITRLRSDIAELDTAAVQQAIEDIQAVQSSRTVVERWNDVSTAYQVLHNVYQQAYTTLFAQRTDCYTQAQQKIAPFGPVPEEITSRIVAPHPDATMQQTLKLADLLMDIQLVEKRTDDIIVRLYSKQQEQQENQQQAVKEENKPLHVLVRTTEFLDGEFCDEQTFEAQIAAFAERVREELRHGRTVVVR